MDHIRRYGSEERPSRCRQLILLARTLQDIRPSQALGRARLMANRAVRGTLRTKARCKASKVWDAHCVPIRLAHGSTVRDGWLDRADEAINGIYEFMGSKVHFDHEIDWGISTQSRLWRFNLNYCAVTLDFAQAFHSTGDHKYIDALCDHVHSWITSNRLMTGDQWTPYTASLRAVNWVLSCSAVWGDLSGNTGFVDSLIGSIKDHMRFIRGNLEYDVRCNHLMENIKALIVGGLFLGGQTGGRAYFGLGQTLLIEQLMEQVLEDGGHCERSMMYHSIVFENLLVIYEAYLCARITPPKEIRRTISCMARFVEGLTMPQGKLPLLNDSAEGIALQPATLLAWAAEITGNESSTEARTTYFPASGLMRVKTRTGSTLVFDCGEPCPQYQPGHAHADTLSIVYTLGDGTEVLVDSGAYEYENSPWRSYFRGTAAHNTIGLDGEDSTEVWGSFRAARKAKILCSGLNELEEAVHLYAEHDGYTRLIGKPIHRRDVYMFDNGILMVIDTIGGYGTHEVASRLHLHPNCSVSASYNCRFSIKASDHNLSLEFLADGDTSCDIGSEKPISGWYAPRLGSKQPCSCITWQRVVDLPYRIGFVLRPSDVGLSVELARNAVVLTSVEGQREGEAILESLHLPVQMMC